MRIRILMSCGLLLSAVSLSSPVAPTSVHVDDVETTRIQNHLSQVVAELGSHEPAGLSNDQRIARRRVLSWLDEYRSAATFPHNHDRPGERVPVFVDLHGTPCAVGYLLLRSGRQELVEAIVSEDNFVRVATLQGDPRVEEWLSEVGLTLSEAALIQPMYDFDPTFPSPSTESYERVTIGLSASTAALAAYSMMTPGESGAPWAEVLLLGVSVGHGYMLWDAADTNTTEPTWATRLNALGIAANLTSALVRKVRRGRAPGARRPEGLQASVLPGRTGTELRLTFRH